MMKTIKRKIQQKFDRDFYKGNGQQFAWLVGIIVAFFLLFVCYRELAEIDISVWRLIELLFDPGAFVGSEKEGNVYFQFLITIVGAVVFTSFTINAIGNFLSRRQNAFSKGMVTYDFDSHILILGSNGMLENILKAVASDPDNNRKDIVIVTDSEVEAVREKVLSTFPSSFTDNLYVLYGNRSQKYVLENVKAADASSIYILGEDDEPVHDGQSLECWRHLKDMHLGRENVIKCYLVLDRLSTEHSFHYKSNSGSEGNLHLIVINAVENSAQRVLVSREYESGYLYPALDREGIGADSDKSVHLVVVGMTQISYAMALTAAHVCHFPNFITKGIRTRISFIMQDIRQEMDFFKGHYSELMAQSYYRYIGADGTLVSEHWPEKKFLSDRADDPKGFLDVEWEFIDGGIESESVRSYLSHCAKADGDSEYLTIAVCGHNPESNVAVSLFLPSEVYEKKIPVFVYQKDSGEVLRSAASADRFGHIYPFGMLNDCYDPQFQERLRWAKRISYIYEHTTDYQSMADEGQLEEIWFRMRYVFQRSNMYAANSIPSKLRSIGVDPSATTQAFSDDQIDTLARLEHNRWNVERLIAGFKALPYAERMDYKARFEDPSTRQAAKEEHNKCKNEKFIHKDIAPYDELLEVSKDYDRTTSRYLLDVIGQF